ncbi:hypothetical protein, partial [Fodinibius sp.]|uniref:hypothetical protein n=1 Tax=Fodinibius sp. TaxID=1872440 RepID=UPI002ACD296E
TGKNLSMQYGLAALASTGSVKGAQYVIDQVPNIPSLGLKNGAVIAGPAMAGTCLSMYAPRNNAIFQGVAGGMVLASCQRPF